MASKTSGQSKKAFIKIGEAAKLLGVSIDTMRRWEEEGRLTPLRTLGGVRLYSAESLRSVHSSKKPKKRPAPRPSSPPLSPSAPDTNGFVAPGFYRNVDSYKKPLQDLPGLSSIAEPLVQASQASDLPRFAQVSWLRASGVIVTLLVVVTVPVVGYKLGVLSLPGRGQAPVPQRAAIQISPAIGSVLAASSPSEMFLEVNTDLVVHGRLTAPNIINSITAGSNVTVDNTNPNNPTISVVIPPQVSVNGIVGGATLKAGTDLSIASSSATLTLSDTSTLASVVGRGGCSSCVSAGDVAQNLVISGGSVDNSPIGATTASTGTFTTLSASGTLSITGAATFSSTINSDTLSSTLLTFAGSNPVISASTAGTNINLNPGTGGKVNLAGGSGSNGCSVDSTNGNLTCAGNVTAAGVTLASYWNRNSGTATLSPATSGDSVATSGSGTITSASTLTASNGFTLSTGAFSVTATSGSVSENGLTGLTETLTSGTAALTAPALNINTSGSGNTALGNSSGTFALTSSGGLNVSTAGALTGVSSITASGTVQGATLNGTSAIQVNGTSINTGGTLSNVDYLDTAQTISAAKTFSVNGAASTPAQKLTGTWFTSGTSTTTKPQLLIEPSGTTSNNWQTTGTALGVNAASGFAGYLMDLQVGAASVYHVDASGNLVISGGLTSGINSGQTLTLTPTTDATALTLVGTNVLTQNLAYFNAHNQSGTVFNIAYGATQTLTGALTGESIDLNNGQVTNSNNNVTGLKVTLPTVTDSNASGTVSIKGLSFGFGTGAGINQTGAGTTTYSGVDVSLPALTQTAGSLTGTGVNITTSSQITTGGTANGINISASGVGAGTLYGVNISGITAGAGTQTALAIGSGWNNILSVNGTTTINGSGVSQVAGGGTGQSSYATGDILYYNSASSTTALQKLAGGAGNNGKILTISSGIPQWAASVGGGICSDCVLTDPSSQTSQVIAPTADIVSLQVKQTSAASPTSDIFDICASANCTGTNRFFYVDSSGNVSTGAISNTTLTLTPTTNTTALTLVGTNVTSQPLQYVNSKNSSAANGIVNLAYGTAQTLTGAVTGIRQDLSTNVTATNQSVTGESVTLPGPTNTNTSGTNTLYGLSVSAGGGLNQNGAGGTTTFSGVNVTIPALTQTAGTLNGYGVGIATPTTITTSGTAAGVNIAASGIGAGTLYGVNISGITAGAGTQNALNIGSGWNKQVNGNGWSVDGTGNITVASCTGCAGNPALSSITAATATNTLANANYAQTWNWGTLTTQTGMTFGGGSAMTSGSIFTVGPGTYVHTALNDTGSLMTLPFTDASTNANNGGVTNGLLISPTLNTSGAGTKTINGLNIGAPTDTACTTGACTYNGLKVTGGSIANITSTALSVDAGSGAGTNYAATFLNGNVGIGTTGPGAKLDTETSATSGTVSKVGAGSAIILSAALTGQSIDLSTNVTNAAQNVTGASVALPIVTAAASNNVTGFSLTSGALTNSSGTTNWNGVKIAMPAITQSGGTLTSVGVNVVGGTITSGTSYALLTDANSGSIGLGTTTPRRRVDILDGSNPQLRLSQADNSKYTDFQTDSSGNLTVTPSGTTVTLSGPTTLTASSLTTVTTSASVTLSSTTLTLGGSATVNGGSAASGTLTLTSTSNATKGNIQFFSSSNSLTSTGAFTVAGNVNSTGGSLQTNGVTRIDNSGNLTAASGTFSSTVSGITTLTANSYTRSCPTGYVVVPGNPKFGTTDFCVMKYPASNDGSGNAVSVATNTPYVSIDQTDSETKCQAAGAHLITENEWMTIAENALFQNANWCNSDGSLCNNAPGTAGKILAAGHNDNSPAQALAASTDDTQACFGTVTAGVNTTCGSAGTQKRTLTMSNGSVLWDIGGNVWEWTDSWIFGSEEPTTATPGFGWREFTAITRWQAFNYANPSAQGWNSTQGLGEIYSDGTSTNTTLYGAIRGGYWGDGSDAGAFALVLDAAPSSVFTRLGFRCAE